MNKSLSVLDEALKQGCIIKVFLCGMRYPVTRIEKMTPDQNKENPALMAYAESNRVLGGLINAAEEFHRNWATDEKIETSPADFDFDISNIEKEVGLRGYNLRIMGLPDGKVSAMICIKHVNYVPIKSVIEDTVESALGLLNIMLSEFDFDFNDFIRFADKQMDLVRKYYETENK